MTWKSSWVRNIWMEVFLCLKLEIVIFDHQMITEKFFMTFPHVKKSIFQEMICFFFRSSLCVLPQSAGLRLCLGREGILQSDADDRIDRSPFPRSSFSLISRVSVFLFSVFFTVFFPINITHLLEKMTEWVLFTGILVTYTESSIFRSPIPSFQLPTLFKAMIQLVTFVCSL